MVAVAPHNMSRPLKLLLLAAIIAVYATSYFHRVAVPGTIFEELQADFGVGGVPASAARITLLGALFLWPYAGMQIFVGVLVDRLGAGRVLLAGAALMALAGLAFPFAPSLAVLYLTRVLLGLGASLIFLSVIKELDALLVERYFALGLGVTLFFGYAGGLIATAPLERGTAAFGWRACMLAAAVVSLAAVVAAAVLVRRTGRIHTGDANYRLATLGVIVRNQASWPIFVASPLCFAIYFLIQAGIGKKMLQDCCGMSSAAAAGVMFVMMALIMVLTFASGFITRAMGDRRKPFLMGGMTCMAASVAIIVWQLQTTPTTGWIVAAFVLAGLAGGTAPTFLCVMKELNRPEAAASAVGVLNALAYTAVAVVMFAAGQILSWLGGTISPEDGRLVYGLRAYQTVFIFCLVLALLAWAVAWLTHETRGRNCAVARDPECAAGVGIG